MGGLILIDREILTHRIIGTSNDRIAMWVWLLAAARWKEEKIFVRGKEITLNRGQLFTSFRVISAKNRVSKGVVERFIRDLKTGSSIETVNIDGGTIITICNYENYQDFDKYRERTNRTANGTAAGRRQDGDRTATGHKRTPEGTPEVTPESIGATEKSDLSPRKKPQKRAIAIPENWIPSDKNIEDAEKLNFNDQEINHEADKFRDYHLAKGSTFKNWDAAWRTWLRNARKFSTENKRGVGSGTVAAFAEVARRV